MAKLNYLSLIQWKFPKAVLISLVVFIASKNSTCEKIRPPAPAIILSISDTFQNFQTSTYPFNIGEPGLLNVTLSSSLIDKIGMAVTTSGGGDLGGTIITDSTSRSLTTRYIDGEETGAFQVELWDVLGQTFGEPAPYTLLVTLEPLDSSHYSSEPKNNTLVGSDGIELNVSHSGYHTVWSNSHYEGYAGDRDWYSFNITEPGYLDIVVTGNEIGLGSMLILYDGSGIEIGSFFGSSQSTTIRTDTIYFDSNELGSYHALVYNDENAFAGSWREPSMGSYTINPTFQPYDKTVPIILRSYPLFSTSKNLIFYNLKGVTAEKSNCKRCIRLGIVTGSNELKTQPLK